MSQIDTARLKKLFTRLITSQSDSTDRLSGDAALAAMIRMFDESSVHPEEIWFNVEGDLLSRMRDMTDDLITKSNAKSKELNLYREKVDPKLRREIERIMKKQKVT